MTCECFLSIDSHHREIAGPARHIVRNEMSIIIWYELTTGLYGTVLRMITLHEFEP